MSRAATERFRLGSNFLNRSIVAQGISNGKGVALLDVQKLYGDVVAVRDVSLQVKPGEFVTLLGPSGSGKTTTLLMIAGFTQPTRGRIFLGGHDVTETPPHRRSIGVVFQNYALFPHMTVFENFAFPLRMRHVPRAVLLEKVAWAVQLVRLEGLEERYPAQLSGGQQQRVALARALIYEPSVVLMDEPLGALDRKLRVQMQTEIKQLQQNLGLTVIYVTHDQEEALAMSDRVAVVNRGVVEQVGLPEELYERPVNRFVADFLGESNFLDARVVEVDHGKLLLTTVGGTVLAAVQTGGVCAGDQVCVSIRPERITITNHVKGKEATSSSVDAVVLQEVYMGDSLRYVLETGTGDKFVAKVPNHARVMRAKGDKRVRLVIEEESVRVYRVREDGVEG